MEELLRSRGETLNNRGVAGSPSSCERLPMTTVRRRTCITGSLEGNKSCGNGAGEYWLEVVVVVVVVNVGDRGVGLVVVVVVVNAVVLVVVVVAVCAARSRSFFSEGFFSGEGGCNERCDFLLIRLLGDCGIALGETGVLRGDLAVVCGEFGEGKGLGVSVSSGMATFVVILGWVAGAVVLVVVGETAVLLVVVMLVVVVVVVFVMFFLSGIGGKGRKFVDCV